MKLNKKSSKMAALLVVLCLGIAAFTGCGKNDSAEEASKEELQEYVAEGVGTFYLPEGFEMAVGASDEVLPMSYAQLTKDSITVMATRFGADAYETAGVDIPADLEEYSQREGVQSGLPDGVEFAKDSYGNLYVKYVEDGSAIYNVLKKGAESYGSVAIICPESELDEEKFALWLSKAVLE